MINVNLTAVKDNIRTAAVKTGRDPGSVRLICVTKEATTNQMFDALSYGATELGENKVQDTLLKFRAIGNKAVWHLIGHLQTNKAKDAVSVFSLIHSVDSVKLAKAINKEAEKVSKIQDVLIEVNVSGEGTKFGISPDELENLLMSVKELQNIHCIGLMTVTPLTDAPENSRGYFRKLKELAVQFGLKELSMGMTQDYQVAIEEGATMVRVGRAIFSS